MTQKINIELETWPGGSSQGFHPVKGEYEYRKAETLTDMPARLTSRQAVFYRNLIRLAEVLQSQTIPIHFIDAKDRHFAMDLGCVKIAEHAGFVEALANGDGGYLDTRDVDFGSVRRSHPGMTICNPANVRSTPDI